MISAEDVVTKFHYDPVEDRMTIERVQDIEPILEKNKRSFNDAPINWKGEFHHVGSIPHVIIEKYKNDTGIDLLRPEYRGELLKFLDRPENRMFRTRPGKLV
jgi:hypothetical protein